MDKMERLQLLSSDMGLEPDGVPDCFTSQASQAPLHLNNRKKDSIVISHAVMSGGKTIPLLKTLLTSACERNCFYCPFRAGRDFHRASFKPDELAQVFMGLYRAGIARGMFLSSGVAGSSLRTQDELIATAEVLRFRYGFQGYLHLKVMPGADRAQIERVMQLADRVSLNLEAPNSRRLELLAPRKTFIEELLQPLRWVEEIRQEQPPHLGWKGRWPSTTTQFVVGAVGESDLELLQTSEYLFNRLRLKRAYYSAFRPIHDTPLENLPAESPVRELRLYQASFLLRDYGFKVDELPIDPGGRLPYHQDPKSAWAEQHLKQAPVEINQADRQALLRVPGIGLKGADAIMTYRRKGVIHTLEDLKKIGVDPSRPAPFIILNGKRPAQQIPLF